MRRLCDTAATLLRNEKIPSCTVTNNSRSIHTFAAQFSDGTALPVLPKLFFQLFAGTRMKKIYLQGVALAALGCAMAQQAWASEVTPSPDENADSSAPKT